MIESMDRLRRWRWGLVVLLVFCAAWMGLLMEGSFGDWYADFLNHTWRGVKWYGQPVFPVVPLGYGLPWLMLFGWMRLDTYSLLSADILVPAIIFLATLAATLDPTIRGNPHVKVSRAHKIAAGIGLAYSTLLVVGNLAAIASWLVAMLVAVVCSPYLADWIFRLLFPWQLITALSALCVIVAVRWANASPTLNWYELTLRRLLRLIALVSAYMLGVMALVLIIALLPGGHFRGFDEAIIILLSIPVSVLYWSIACLSVMLFRWPAHRAAMIDGGVRYCRLCGYDLTGTRMAGREVCPECGEIQDACDANAAVFEHGHGN